MDVPPRSARPAPTTSQHQHSPITPGQRHGFTAEQFTALGRGGGSRDAIEVLVASQRSKRLVQLREVNRRARRFGGSATTSTERAFALLTTAEARRPKAVRRVLAHPYLDNWASTCLRQFDIGGSDDGQPLGALDYLTALAAAAAALAGMRFEVELPSSGGTVVLPTLGAVTGLGPGPVRIVGGPGRLVFVGSARRVTVALPHQQPSEHWAPRRLMQVGDARHRYQLAIEDLDPYRDCYQWQPTDRLTDRAAAGLGRRFRLAWKLITRQFPDYATGIRASLVSVVPLAPAAEGTTRGATSFHAFGSVAISTVTEPESLALSLIHEFQHMKLVAINDLIDLHGADPGGCYLAPWRSDPRPLPALLQGTYAHLGVCDFWRRRRRGLTDPAALRSAHFEFALWRRLTLLAADNLLETRVLTRLGAAFVEPMARELVAWGNEAVPSDIDRYAADAALAYIIRWRVTNGATPTDDLGWLANSPRPAWLPERVDLATLFPVATASQPADPVAAEPQLVTLIRATISGAEPGTGAAAPTPSPADLAYLDGRFSDAVRGYASAVRRGDIEGWTRLAVAFGRESDLSRRVTEHLGLARRLHEAGDGQADPADVLRWLVVRLTRR
ncbi:HEXXH motif domain-containing protein [Plantactinospora sp. WMMC1484]|uniref:HEXXH motif domain-containing protein n=1 Tax=Plantactinospora sp. WMMC1484 TaxID=3404122 RepID=UPI003BF60EFD